MRGFCVHFFNRKLLPSSNCVLRPHLLLGYQIQTEAHRSHNSFSCHMIQLSLYTILGTKEANQRRHVTSDSQSSDRSGGSYLSQIFLQKSPWTSKKSTLSLASSLNQFCEKALNFLQNQPAVQQARFIEISKEDLRFLLNQTAVLVLSKQFFLEKPSNFN